MSNNKNKTKKRLRSSTKESSDDDIEQKIEKYDELLEKISSLIESQKKLEEKFDLFDGNIKATVASLVKTVDDLKKENAALKGTISSLSFRINHIEQKSQKNKIEIDGIVRHDGEQLIDVVLQLSGVCKADLTAQDIKGIHRLSPKSEKRNGMPGTVVVDIPDDIKRKNFVKLCRQQKNLNGSVINLEKMPLYVNYKLTKASKFLLARAKEKKKEGLIKYVWISDGDILLRKDDNARIVKLYNTSQLSTFIQ